MPIYEYACRQCGHEFETLVRSNALASCPSCSSQALDKKLSLFRTGSSGGGATSEASASGGSAMPRYGHVCSGGCSH